MTITLTREEAQQVLDALELANGSMTADDVVLYTNEEIETLRARLSAPECVCGEPNTAGVHRQDGPCYQQPEPDAIQYDKDGNEMAHWRFSSFLPAPEPEPVGWIYEDDEGRMMFSQMPQNPPFWEPVYRANVKEKRTCAD
jgi:hypothetical protein